MRLRLCRGWHRGRFQVWIVTQYKPRLQSFFVSESQVIGLVILELWEQTAQTMLGFTCGFKPKGESTSWSTMPGFELQYKIQNWDFGIL